MKKIGIVTVYNACNYGSFLQAYGLKSFLEKEGNCLVDFISIPVEEEKVIGKGFLSAEEMKFETEKYEKLIDNQMIFNVVNKIDDSYSCCVIGSDTIWNLFDRTYQDVPYFLGKEIDCSNIVSYAASVGQSRIIKILIKKYFKLLPIRKLNSISVRDDNTEKIIHYLFRKCVRVLDPTFLYEFEIKEPANKVEEKYILVYTYGFDKEKISEIKKYAQKNRLKVVATGSLCEWADYNLALDSFEWLWYIKHAEAIITGTFHGTVFSIKYNKNFVVLSDSSAKVRSLLREFDLENRVTSSMIESILEDEIDYERVNKIIDAKVNYSKKWLLSNLGEDGE